MVEELISSNHIEHCFVPLLTLCGKGIKQSQFSRETDDSESNFEPCKGKPNTHAWSTIESLPSNRLPFIPVRGSVPLSPAIGLQTSSLIAVFSPNYRAPTSSLIVVV